MPNAQKTQKLLNKFIACQILSLDSGVTCYIVRCLLCKRRMGGLTDSARVRTTVRTTGLKKITGQSRIEVKKKVYIFSAGSTMQLELGLEEVYSFLDELGTSNGKREPCIYS